MSIYHAEPDINILLTRYFIDMSFAFHCIVRGLNQTIEHVINVNVT